MSVCTHGGGYGAPSSYHRWICERLK
jgi:hypothetical protein